MAASEEIGRQVWIDPVRCRPPRNASAMRSRAAICRTSGGLGQARCRPRLAGGLFRTDIRRGRTRHHKVWTFGSVWRTTAT